MAARRIMSVLHEIVYSSTSASGVASQRALALAIRQRMAASRRHFVSSCRFKNVEAADAQ